jgi:hypothetical protein
MDTTGTIAAWGIEILVAILGLVFAVLSPYLGFLSVAMRRALFRQADLDEDDERFVTWVFAIGGLAIAAVAIYFIHWLIPSAGRDRNRLGPVRECPSAA